MDPKAKDESIEGQGGINEQGMKIRVRDAWSKNEIRKRRRKSGGFLTWMTV